MHVCRYCKESHNRERFFKYAARHWAHYGCWLKTNGLLIKDPSNHKDVLAMLEDGLHGWQLRNFPVFKLADWLEDHKTSGPGKTWTDKACNILKKAIEHAEKGTVKA